MPSFTIKKQERLKSRKIIGNLFKEGQSFPAYPLRLVFKPIETTSLFPIQFTISIPKRAFPKAVHRNQIRRKVREAYRLQKHVLYRELEPQNQQFAFMMIYVAKEQLPYAIIERAMTKMIRKFINQLNLPAN